MLFTSSLSSSSSRKLIITATIVLFGVVGLTILSDFLGALFRGSAFYMSESFMFSSFWWLFAPILILQQQAFKRKLLPTYLLIIVPAILHLFSYPALVWAISRLFYYHTFRYSQTLGFEISTYTIKLLICYTVPPIIYYFISNRKVKGGDIDSINSSPIVENKTELPVWWVLQGNKKIPLEVSSIHYLVASSPYLEVHTANNRFLVTDTLKSAIQKLGPEFMRVHKSTIINTSRISEVRSRQNGDYDIRVQKSELLRVSRNYAAGFRKFLKNQTQVT